MMLMPAGIALVSLGSRHGDGRAGLRTSAVFVRLVATGAAVAVLFRVLVLRRTRAWPPEWWPR